MEKYSIREVIVPKVRGILLENMDSEELEDMEDPATLSLNGAIEECVVEAAVVCHRLAPVEVFKELETDKVAMGEGNRGGLTRRLIRCVRAEGEGWRCPVFDVELDRVSVAYYVAKDELNGTVGTVERPYVCVHGMDVEAWPRTKDGVVTLTGVAYPAKTDEGEVTCDGYLMLAVCYYCAYLVAMAKGMTNAEGYRMEALASMGISVNNA